MQISAYFEACGSPVLWHILIQIKARLKVLSIDMDLEVCNLVSVLASSPIFVCSYRSAFT